MNLVEARAITAAQVPAEDLRPARNRLVRLIEKDPLSLPPQVIYQADNPHFNNGRRDDCACGVPY